MSIGTFGGAITLASVSDGASGSGHTIEVNHNKIYKFYPQNSADPSYSPVAFNFKLTSGGTVESVSDYTSEISLVGTDSQISNIWALLGRLEGYPLVETETPQAENLLTATRIINLLTNTIEFRFVELFGYDIDKPELGNAQEDIETFHDLLDMIRDENCYFIIDAFQNNSPISTAALPLEFGTSKDMAKFAVTASTIEAAVGESKLEFNVNGLSVRNGGLTIYNNENEKIFYYDNTEHLLYIMGNGTFTGEINATSGSFTGDVSADTLTANAGTIGGFTIQDTGLYSTDENQSLKLLSDGSIDAENINLGTGAHLNRYLQLGDNAFIWNPDDEQNVNHYFIEVKDSNNLEVVTLDDSGVLKVGAITLDGRTSTIYGDSFSITPNLASFNNIAASGKISTAVFEHGHLQSAGGSMMFRPAYKIDGRNNNILTLDQDFQGQVGDYVYVIKDDGTPVSGLIQVTAKSGSTVTLDNIAYNGDLISLIDIGAEGDIIIGINSSDTSSTFLRPRGITISEFNLGQLDPEDPTTKYIDENITPKVFLGDLDTSGITFSDTPKQTRGYGLYSENVYLTGSLTTKVNTTNPTFAGVNTLDGISATVFVEHNYGNDTSPIVFWAGSAGTEPRQIQAAPFQVTANGSIYATQGIFTGAIITESFISGADLYAARIHGTGTEQDGYGLAFFDCEKGIVFYEGNQSTVPSPTEIFSIGTTGLRKGNNYFIEVGASGVNFDGNNYKGINYFTDTTQSSYIHLYQNSIIGAHTINENEESADANITFNQQGMNFGVTNSTTMNITQNLIKMRTDSVQIDNTVLFGEQLKYEKVANGYDLFVLS